MPNENVQESTFYLMLCGDPLAQLVQLLQAKIRYVGNIGEVFLPWNHSKMHTLAEHNIQTGDMAWLCSHTCRLWNPE